MAVVAQRLGGGGLFQSGLQVSRPPRLTPLPRRNSITLMERRASQVVGTLLVIAAITLLVSCTGKPFSVKPSVDLTKHLPPVKARVGEMVVAAAPVVDEDLLFDVFDANLILAGVLPVMVKVTNKGSEQIELERVRWELAGDGGELDLLDTKGAFKRLISYYGISTYSKRGYRESLGEFKAYELDRENALAPLEERRGVMFFGIKNKELPQSGFVLTVRMSKAEQVELRLSE